MSAILRDMLETGMPTFFNGEKKISNHHAISLNEVVNVKIINNIIINMNFKAIKSDNKRLNDIKYIMVNKVQYNGQSIKTFEA